MTVPLQWLRLGSAARAAIAVFASICGVATNSDGLGYRLWSSYVGHLDRALRNLFLPARAVFIALLQLVGVGLFLAVGLASSENAFFLGVPLCLALPSLTVWYLRKRRVQAIEAKIESFLLTLANALKATPSLGSALGYTQPLLAAPLDQELELALKEMRVGSSLEQALLNLAARVQSPKLDAALASLLIGRQVGGNLTQILETTAATLREMSRLQGVVRSKTAEGKSQLFVLALFPAALVFLFDWVKPNYFAPLTGSVVGALIGLMALALWGASIVVARKVLMVDL